MLSGGTRSEVASELWDHSNPLSEYDEVKGFARDDGASLHNSDHDSKSRSIKKSKILDYKCAACSNPKMIGYAQDEAYFRILDSHVDNDLIESFDTMHQLGFGSCPLDSSFEGASVLCPTGPGPQGSGGCIPVLQGILVGDCCADEVSSSSVSCSPGGAAMPSKAHLKPTRANCHFALLVLPAVHQSAVSVSVSRQVDASGKSSDEPDLLHKIVLKSTGSVAFVQLGE